MKNLLILLAIFVLGAMGCSKEVPSLAQLRVDETALVRATVVDPARAARFLELLEERDQLIEETSVMMQQYRRELKSINANYDANREIIVEMIDYYNRDRGQKQLRFIKLIRNMKATTTAAEWKVIAEFHLDNFNPRQLLYARATGGV
jgi:hypothetical protein